MEKFNFEKVKSYASKLKTHGYAVEQKEVVFEDYDKSKGIFRRIEFNSSLFGGSVDFNNIGSITFDFLSYNSGVFVVNNTFWSDEVNKANEYVEPFFDLVFSYSDD